MRVISEWCSVWKEAKPFGGSSKDFGKKKKTLQRCLSSSTQACEFGSSSHQCYFTRLYLWSTRTQQLSPWNQLLISHTVLVNTHFYCVCFKKERNRFYFQFCRRWKTQINHISRKSAQLKYSKIAFNSFIFHSTTRPVSKITGFSSLPCVCNVFLTNTWADLLILWHLLVPITEL